MDRLGQTLRVSNLGQIESFYEFVGATLLVRKTTFTAANLLIFHKKSVKTKAEGLMLIRDL